MTFKGMETRKLLLIASLALLALLVLDRLVVSPLLAGWRERQERIAELRIQLAQADNLLGQESRWLRWREEAAERLLPVNQADAENQLLGLVDGWAREAGLKVTSLRPLWKETPAKRLLLELQISGSGNMASLTRFLHAIETGHTAIAVEQLDLSAQDQDGRELGLNMRVSGLCRDSAVRTGAGR